MKKIYLLLFFIVVSVPNVLAFEMQFDISLDTKQTWFCNGKIERHTQGKCDKERFLCFKCKVERFNAFTQVPASESDEPQEVNKIMYYTVVGMISSVSQPRGGRYQLVADNTNNLLYKSSDTGVTFTNTGVAGNFRKIAISDNGKIQVASSDGDGLWLSDNYGDSFIDTGEGGSADDIHDVALSRDGKYIGYVIENGIGRLSSNYGASFTDMLPSNYWYGLGMSKNGQYISAIRRGGQIHVSQDTGNNFTPKGSTRNWNDIAVNDKGKIQVAVYNGGIDKSEDFGDSWTTIDSNARDYRAVTISNDGQCIVAAVLGGQIFVSTNGGTNFIARATIENWQDLDISNSGLVISATSSSDIWVSVDQGANFVKRSTHVADFEGVGISGN